MDRKEIYLFANKENPLIFHPERVGNGQKRMIIDLEKRNASASIMLLIFVVENYNASRIRSKCWPTLSYFT